MGALDFARLELQGDEVAQEVITVGLQAAERARTLVQRLLAFGRRQHLQPQDIDAESLMDSAVELAQRSLRPGIRLVLDMPDTLPAVHADPDQVVLAVLNLVVNARDAIEGVGNIILRVREDNDPGQEGLLPGRYLRIDVCDDGCGMDEAVVARAAEPFFTTKPTGQGTGLGLASVQGLAVQSGGGFKLASTPGEGTTVSLWMPASTKPGIDSQRQGAQRSRTQVAKCHCILLVDDDALVRASGTSSLRRAGYDVVQAADGEEALALLDAAGPFDLLVTDYAMPGLSGLELIDAVRLRKPQMPILMVTGYADTGQEAADVPRLQKPFLPAELVDRVQALIAEA